MSKTKYRNLNGHRVKVIGPGKKMNLEEGIKKMVELMKKYV